MDSSSGKAISWRVSAPNLRLRREFSNNLSLIGDISPSCPLHSNSSLSSGEMKKENEKSSHGNVAPPPTPEKVQRTYIFSSAYRPPFSKRVRHSGPSLPPELLASHAFDPPATGYDFDDRLEAPHYAPAYHKALQASLSPITASSTSDTLFEPELSTDSDISDDQRSLLSGNSISPLLSQTKSRIQSSKEHQVAETESSITPQPLHSDYPTPISILHKTPLYINPPLGTFRSSHAHRLRSESHADARERAKLKEKQDYVSNTGNKLTALALETLDAYNESRLSSGSHGGINKEHKGRKGVDDGGPCEENKEDMDYRKIVLGISELDIFGVSAVTANMNMHSSSPWKRSVRAPVPFSVKSRRSASKEDGGGTFSCISTSAPT